LIRFLFLGVVLLLALPFKWGKLTGLSFWFSPFLMLNSVFVLKSLVTLNIIGFIILLIVWFKKRWFCNYLCPVGFLLGKVPHCKQTQTKVSILKVPHINKWLVIISLGGALIGFPFFIFLDPILIFNGFFMPFIQPFHYEVLFLCAAFPLLLMVQFLVPDLWCERLCPLGGLQLFISELKSLTSGSSSKSDKFDIGRRVFIGGTLGTLAAVALPNVVDPNSEMVIRPPGSIENFNTLCIRCGSCIKVCPTQILKHNTRIGFGLLTPVIKFNDSYCLENCNLCSVVCPSGSITLFSIEAKKMLRIGQMEVNQDTCLLMKLKECGICKNACHYKAIDIVDVAINSLQMRPAINEFNCNGCGACAAICPENCFTIKPMK